jgi:hypothetical protein
MLARQARPVFLKADRAQPLLRGDAVIRASVHRSAVSGQRLRRGIQAMDPQPVVDLFPVTVKLRD